MYMNIKVAPSIAARRLLVSTVAQSGQTGLILCHINSGGIFMATDLWTRNISNLLKGGNTAIHFMQSPKSGPLKVIVSDISGALCCQTDL